MTISFFPRVIRGAETAARKRGYSLIAVNSDDDGERQKELLSLLRSQRVEGILLVIAAAPMPLNQLARILDASIPMVCLDRIPDRLPVDSVSRGGCARGGNGSLAPDRDGRAADRDRHRRDCAQERTAAAAGLPAGAMPRRVIPVDEDLIWHGNFRAEDVSAICRGRLYDPATRPDAVFCTNGPTALGVLRALTDCGLQTPARHRFRHLRRTHGGRSVQAIDHDRGTAGLRHRLRAPREILLDRIEGVATQSESITVRLPAILKVRESSRRTGVGTKALFPEQSHSRDGRQLRRR